LDPFRPQPCAGSGGKRSQEEFVSYPHLQADELSAGALSRRRLPRTPVNIRPIFSVSRGAGQGYQLVVDPSRYTLTGEKHLLIAGAASVQAASGRVPPDANQSRPATIAPMLT
jgi:hypothetical protein